MNEQITIKELFSLDKTIAAGIFEGAVYPWEVLSKIGDYIVGLGWLQSFVMRLWLLNYRNRRQTFEDGIPEFTVYLDISSTQAPRARRGMT